MLILVELFLGLQGVHLLQLLDLVDVGLRAKQGWSRLTELVIFVVVFKVHL